MRDFVVKIARLVCHFPEQSALSKQIVSSLSHCCGIDLRRQLVQIGGGIPLSSTSEFPGESRGSWCLDLRNLLRIVSIVNQINFASSIV